MKKNFKLAFIALLIVALSLCTLLTACSEKHEHSYTELGHDATNHWYYCAEDGQVNETSVQAHKFEKLESDANQHWKVCTVCGVVDSSPKANHIDVDEDGKCDVCQHSVPIPIKYGTISGTIDLYKAGAKTPAGSNVTLSLSDDQGEVTPIDLVVADGKFSFTAVEGEYTLTASATGYIDATFTIELAKADPVVDFEIELQYSLLAVSATPGYDGDLHDFSHQNDENGYVLFNSNVTGKTLDFTTVDTMDDAMFTWYAQSGLSFNGDQRVGVWAMFDDNGTPRYAWFTLKGKDNVFEWLGVDEHWDVKNALPGIWGFDDNALSAEEIDQYQKGTLQMGIARHQNMLFAIVNDQIRDTRILPEKYATMDCRLGMAGFDAGCADGAAKYYFSISTDIAGYLPADTFTVTVPTVENLTITPSRTTGHKGQGVDITFEPASGYSLVSVKVNGTEKIAELVDGVLSIANYNGEAITAQVVKNAEVTANVTVTGLDGAKLTFKQGETEKEVTVTDGVAAFDGATGIWEVFTTYQGATFSLGSVVVGADGTATLSKTDITLFNDKDVFGWNKPTEDKFNVATGKGELHLISGDVMMHTTSVGYDDVAITMYLAPNAGGDTEGLFMLFGNKCVRVFFEKESAEGKTILKAIKWNGETDRNNNNPENITMSAKEVFDSSWQFHNTTGAEIYNDKSYFTSAEQELFAKGELKFTLVRHGKMIYAFFNDKYIGLRNVGEDLATASVNCGLSLFGVTDSHTRKVKYAIETDISSYLAKCEGDATFSSSSEHVTIVTPENVKVNDRINISFKVDAGYVITKISVDGREYDPYQKSINIWVNRPNFEVEITAVPTTEVSELEHNRIGDPNNGDASKVDDSTSGKITTTGTTLFENTRLEYADGAISLTLKQGQFTATAAGVGYAFGGGQVGNAYGNNEQDSLIFRMEVWNGGAGVQWVGDWWYGLRPINGIGTWNIDTSVKDYAPFSNELYNAYANGDGITLTIARVGDTVYALVNGTIVSTQYVNDYTGKTGRLFVLVPDAVNGAAFDYQLYSATEVTTLIANAKTLLSGEDETPVRKVIGTVGYTSEGGITFDGSGVVEVGNGSLKESLTITVGNKYATDGPKKMGIMYRFANGKFLFVRSEMINNGEAFKIQFSQDSTFNRAGDAFLQGWKDYNQSDETIISAFKTDSLNLTLERNGNVFTVKLGDTVLDTITLSEEYATMAGQMMIDVNCGNVENAFTFTYADNSTAE